MKGSLRTGVTFGITSGVITTLGLMIGLHSGTHSKLAVVGGIVTIAVADAFSDALGIHISEEAKNSGPAVEVWEATVATFAAKCVIALSFVVPVLVLELDTAIAVAAVWGLSLLSALSFVLARMQGSSPWKVIGEHVAIGVSVIAIAHYLGEWVRLRFG